MNNFFIQLKQKLSSTTKIADFLFNRLTDNSYRGLQVSQHNRWVMNDVVEILKILEKYNRLEILVGDEGKNIAPKEYIDFVTEIKNKLGNGTQNSIKKNLFPDFARMGLINRYDKNNEYVNESFDIETRCRGIKYVEISKNGINFIHATNLKEQYFIFFQGIEILSQGHFYQIKDLIIQTQDSIGSTKISISQKEYALFISGIEKSFNNHYYSYDDILAIYTEFKKQSSWTKLSIISLVKDYCRRIHNSNPKSKSFDRDWGNWINEAQQTINLFGQTSIFECDNKYNLFLKFNSNSMYSNLDEMKRSIIEKYKYWEKHNISKTPAYELHHIMSLYEAKTIDEFKCLDVWENMIYINGNSHNSIHSMNYFKLYELSFEKNDDIKITSLFNTNKFIICSITNKDVLYNPSLKNVLLKKNRELLTLVKLT